MPFPHIAPVRTASTLLAAVLLAACGGGDGPTDPPPPPPTLSASAAGRMERGSELVLTATEDGQALAAGQVAWSVIPADAGSVTGDRLRLLRAGQVQVRATHGERTSTLTLQVAVPPSVAFEMAVGGNRDVYRVALDGGDFVRLTSHASSDADVTAAAGSIVFVSYRAGNAELFSMPAGGGTETRITTSAQSETAPSLSPDGQRLAYATGSGATKVWTAQASGAGAAQAAPGFGFAGSPETSPAWAPTGNRLAFVGAARGGADLYTLTPGGAPVLLAPHARPDIDPAWSPDGARIAFASTRDGDLGLYLVNVADGAVTRLSTRAGDEAEPTWTADGRLVYVEFESTGATRLVWIDPAFPNSVYPIPVTGGAPRGPAALQ
ncbi:MAG TPA: hypothetical protein VGC13_30235 [Longimicrobium sp.]|jgi:TolB protein|uniref:hypothetical protein n=1 Tax=Longimicrobium sp. TaxID=2029185 RepID=UPI002EDBB510